MTEVPKIRTPCVGTCTLDGDTGWCKGCGRTANEVGGWVGMTDDERAEVMTKLPDRMLKLWEERRKDRREKRARERGPRIRREG